MKVELISIHRIHRNPFQTREKPSESDIQILADSISKSGLQNPITVRPHPEIAGQCQLISGERRLLACRRLGWEMIPALVRDKSDLEAAELCLVENMQREALNPVEEAKGYKILREKFAYTPTKIAKLIGKDRSYVSNRLRLLGLDYFVQECVLYKTIEVTKALVIAGLPYGYEQYIVADLVMDWRLTFAETRHIVNEVKNGARMFSWAREVPVEGLEEFSSNRVRPVYPDDELIESMRTWGQLEPIEVFVTGVILDGRKRYRAAKFLGWDTLKARVWFMTAWLKLNPDATVIQNPKCGPSPRGIHPEPTSEEMRRVARLNMKLKAYMQGARL